MSRSFGHMKVVLYVRAKRKEFGLPSRKPSCSGWRKHFHAATEMRVMEAPNRLGYLIALWWDLHMKWFSATDDAGRARYEPAKLEVMEMIHAEIRQFVERPGREGLELRSDGWFVRVVRERTW